MEKMRLQHLDEDGEDYKLPMQNSWDAKRQGERRRVRRRAWHLVAISFLAFCALRSWSPSRILEISDSLEISNTSFNWSALSPSSALTWYKCYDEHECARLSVPLDYSDPRGESAAVAIIKYPANLTSNKKYLGPILVNPGGPGDSGVGIIKRLGKVLQAIAGEQFDMIGFDPRGVGLTTPTFNSYRDKNEAGRFYLDLPTSMNASTDALGKIFASSGFLGTRLQDSSRKVLEHVSTPVVARDMLSITKALGEEKLQYWGFSYGTILGATFSAMFPDKVGRVVIDGVGDAEDYYSGRWSNSLRDADAALLDICDACAKAGKEMCGLAEDTADKVLERVNALLTRLKTAPMPIYLNASEGYADPQYGVVTYEVIERALIGTLYKSHATGAFMFKILEELEKGNALPALPLLADEESPKNLLSCDCSVPGQTPAPFYGSGEHTLAIACGDSALENETFAELQAVYDEIGKTSMFGDIWTVHALCSGWKVKGKERFQGTFNHKTSHPLLLVSNTKDPVTPLWAAQKMSKGFEGSVVLTQNASGHCSVSAVSLCTHKAIRAYFQNGTLPEKGTVCDTESRIFGGEGNLLDEVDRASIAAEDFALLEASYLLQQNYFVPMLGGVGRFAF